MTSWRFSNAYVASKQFSQVEKKKKKFRRSVSIGYSP